MRVGQAHQLKVLFAELVVACDFKIADGLPLRDGIMHDRQRVVSGFYHGCISLHVQILLLHILCSSASGLERGDKRLFIPRDIGIRVGVFVL